MSKLPAGCDASPSAAGMTFLTQGVRACFGCVQRAVAPGQHRRRDRPAQPAPPWEHLAEVSPIEACTAHLPPTAVSLHRALCVFQRLPFPNAMPSPRVPPPPRNCAATATGLTSWPCWQATRTAWCSTRRTQVRCAVLGPHCTAAAGDSGSRATLHWQPPFSDGSAARSRPAPLAGFWLMHCHVGDHISGGMLATYMVTRNESLPLLAGVPDAAADGSVGTDGGGPLRCAALLFLRPLPWQAGAASWVLGNAVVVGAVPSFLSILFYALFAHYPSRLQAVLRRSGGGGLGLRAAGRRLLQRCAHQLDRPAGRGPGPQPVQPGHPVPQGSVRGIHRLHVHHPQTGQVRVGAASGGLGG